MPRGFHSYLHITFECIHGVRGQGTAAVFNDRVWNDMTARLLEISAVLPSQDIGRDVRWYSDYVGFERVFGDKMYAVLKRDDLHLHLQWHADTPDDPLLGGSVIKIFVEDIRPLFEELVTRQTITPEKLRMSTPWRTNEFGFFDLNGNAIFFVQDLD